MKYIRQKDNYECAVACIVMLTGHPYDKVRKYFPDLVKNKGVFQPEILKVLDDLKFPYFYRGHMDWKKSLRKPIVLSEINDAIFSIKCLSENLRHAVIWNSKKRTFWCPTFPPLNCIQVLIPSYKDVKNFYKDLPGRCITETFNIIEAKPTTP
jgi:hypothetical protein